MPFWPLHLEVMDELGALSTEWDDVVVAHGAAQIPAGLVAGRSRGRRSRHRRVVRRRGRSDRRRWFLNWTASAADRSPVEQIAMPGTGAPPRTTSTWYAPTDVADVPDAVLAWLRDPDRVVDLDGLADGGARWPGSLRDHMGEPHRCTVRVASPEVASTGTWPPTREAAVDDRSGRPSPRGGRIDHGDGDRPGDERRAGPTECGPRPERALPGPAPASNDQRWSDESGVPRRLGPIVAVATAGIERGEVRIHEVTSAAGEVVATELDLVLGDVVAFYQAGPTH